MLDGKPVSLTRLKGGLNLATTQDKNGNDQVLGAASHQAILCYSVEQRYPNFQPAMMKSEGLKLIADSHSHFLSDDLRKNGHDIYSVQNGNEIGFYLTKQNIKISEINSSIENNYLSVNVSSVPKECVNAISCAISEKALSSGLKGVRVK